MSVLLMCSSPDKTVVFVRYEPDPIETIMRFSCRRWPDNLRQNTSTFIVNKPIHTSRRNLVCRGLVCQRKVDEPRTYLPTYKVRLPRWKKCTKRKIKDPLFRNKTATLNYGDTLCNVHEPLTLNHKPGVLGEPRDYSLGRDTATPIVSTNRIGAGRLNSRSGRIPQTGRRSPSRGDFNSDAELSPLWKQ